MTKGLIARSTLGASMPRLRIVMAFLCGALLFQVAVIQAGGLLAAMTVPAAYFEGFGRSHAAVALALVQLVTLALPVCVMVAGGVLATCRIVGGNAQAMLPAVLAGLVACFLFWFIQAMASLSRHGVPISGQLMVPWWALPGVLAPWLGFAWAAWLLRRTPRQRAQRDRSH